MKKLSMSYYHDKQTGQLMSRVINDTAAFENLIAHALPEVTTHVLTSIGVLIAKNGVYSALVEYQSLS